VNEWLVSLVLHTYYNELQLCVGLNTMSMDSILDAARGYMSISLICTRQVTEGGKFEF
jgi:hypothetical protein